MSPLTPHSFKGDRHGSENGLCFALTGAWKTEYVSAFLRGYRAAERSLVRERYVVKVREHRLFTSQLLLPFVFVNFASHMPRTAAFLFLISPTKRRATIFRREGGCNAHD